MATIPLFAFNAKQGQSNQLPRLEARHFGNKIVVEGEPHDSGTQDAVDEIIAVLKSLRIRDDALADFANQIRNVLVVNNLTSDPPPQPPPLNGYTGSFTVPQTFTVAVVGCTVTLSVATELTVTVERGLITGVA